MMIRFTLSRRQILLGVPLNRDTSQSSSDNDEDDCGDDDDDDDDDDDGDDGNNDDDDDVYVMAIKTVEGELAPTLALK